MRLRLVPVVVVLALGAAAAGAQGVAFLRVCGDPDQSAAQAVQFCRRALEAGGLSPAQAAAAAANLGAGLLELDRPAEAETAYDRAIATDPEAAFAHAGRARARSALGKVALAAVDWNRAVSLAPDDAGLRAGRGAFRLRAGNAAGALDDFETALRRGSTDHSLDFNRALALAAVGQADAADAVFSTLLGATPQDASIWLARARLRLAHDRDAALADYDAAVTHAGEWSQPWFERATLLDEMGRTEAANRDFRRAWELGHRDPELTERMLTLGQ